MSTNVSARSADERVRLAWRCYAGRVRDLEGEHYLAAERDAWAELQATLRDIARESDMAQAA